MKPKKYDFSGYVTRYGVKCTDGRTLMPESFAHCDGRTVPLVFQHVHDNPLNVVGNIYLEHKADGMYGYGSFNDTEAGSASKEAVVHGDIKALSIYANRLQQNSRGEVYHGEIREVSLVLAGANVGAFIDNIAVSHSEDGEELGEAIIYTTTDETCDLELAHAESEKTIEDVVNTMDEDQLFVLNYLVEKAASKNGSVKHSDEDEDEEELEDEESEDEYDDEESDEEEDEDEESEDNDEQTGGDEMKVNLFEKQEQTGGDTIQHSDLDFAQIVADAQKAGCKLSEAVLAHADTYGIKDIESLFPQPKEMNMPPEWYKQDDEWVSGWLADTQHSPFSRIRTRQADITADEARAKGYVKGNRKTPEVFSLMTRTTSPTTVYKKQHLDEDDIIDITDFSVVPWVKGEMRMMLNKEVAVAGLLGDGRAYNDPDKIDEEKIRPVWKDNELYTIRRQITFPENATYLDKLVVVEETVLKVRKLYRGSGNPTLYASTDFISALLLARDQFGHRLYKSLPELATALRVKRIVEVPDMADKVYTDDDGNEFDLCAIMLNPFDYRYGADKGGGVRTFEDFDIDFNLHKYLMETRCSGALRKIMSAVVIESGHFDIAKLVAEAVAPTTDLLGKNASELQNGVRINEQNEIRGTLKYVKNYTGFSGDPAEQNGNFLALHFDTEEGSETTVEIVGGTSGPATLDSDNLWVGKIANKQQTIRVVTSKNSVVTTKIYSLKYITLEPDRS